jgi:hypothetical protein
MMRWTLALFAALALFAFEAQADRDATDAEKASIAAALEAVGCSGGKIEADDDDDDDAFEVDDATCADGTYDIELDKTFKITKRERDD